MPEVRPWLKDGKKIRTMDGQPVLCDKCPCPSPFCPSCAEHVSEPGFAHIGYYAEIWGIPCGGDCEVDTPQLLGVVDYTHYHDQHPDWEGPCIWYQEKDGCRTWYVV